MNWNYYKPVFEYEESFNDYNWPWAGHKNFGYDLVSNVRPKRVVELGTHKGTSFFSFCQAVKDQSLDCEVFAIDTWKGDPHASYYDERVFLEVNEIKNKYYNTNKINLLRTTFDESVDKFSEKSIDILHIDGFHTYDAVKHDYDTWFNKVTDNGIILLHDIYEKRDDFGVYKFWDEIKEGFATLEFKHSHGLGVLFKNPESYLNLIENKDILRKYYSLLFKYKILNNSILQKNPKMTSLNNIIQQRDREILELKKIIHQNNLITINQQYTINSLYTSLSWRITSPLRYLNQKMLNLFTIFRNQGK